MKKSFNYLMSIVLFASTLIISCKKAELEPKKPLVLKDSLAYSGSGGLMNVHYYWNAGSTDQYFTKNFGELGYGGNGWQYLGVKFRTYDYMATPTEINNRQYKNIYTMYRPSTGAHLVTTDWQSAYNIGYTQYDFLGFVPYSAQSNMVPLYGYINPKLSRNHYTLNFNELGTGKNDWVYKGITTYVFLP